jgi:uncharacterized protein (DUF924 family)
MGYGRSNLSGDAGRKVTIMSGPEEIVCYWSTPGYDADAETFRQQDVRWMRGEPEVDEEIAEWFTAMLEKAGRGELDLDPKVEKVFEG